jgi:hypothetical protein
MPVYFVAENENNDYSSLRIKIGRAKNINARLRALQTGSPYDLKLMGWIDRGDDNSLEKALHELFADQRIRLEWFHLQPEDVLTQLKSYGIYAYVATEENSFEIVSRDNDGVPEYCGPWKWGDVDVSEFCPKCGCGCGLQYNENYGVDRCLKCGIIYDYDENS